jgi:hypothetical protein
MSDQKLTLALREALLWVERATDEEGGLRWQTVLDERGMPYTKTIHKLLDHGWAERGNMPGSDETRPVRMVHITGGGQAVLAAWRRGSEPETLRATCLMPEVTAQKVRRHTEIQTPEGGVLARVGDWVLTGPDGTQRVMRREAFRVFYRATDPA